MKSKTNLLIVVLSFILIFQTGCGAQKADPIENSTLEQIGQKTGDLNLAQVQPNELGRVMILMYHQIGPKEGEWTRTPENFRKDLERLYKNGYRLVSLKDYLNNNISVPAGYTPVILTFDDGPANQFRYIEQNNELIIDPDCAVGIITEFARKNPDFGTAASFYVNFPASAFGQREYTAKKFAQLLEFEMDIGNHSYSHQYFNRLSTEEVEKELSLQVKEVQKILPGYSIDSLALPFGLWPKERSAAVSGNYDGISYDHKAILLVGAHPAPSPISDRFNPLALPRIRGSQEELDKWFNHFEQKPEDRYISDGNPDLITIREDVPEFSRLNNEALDGKQVKTYSLEQIINSEGETTPPDKIG